MKGTRKKSSFSTVTMFSQDPPANFANIPYRVGTSQDDFLFPPVGYVSFPRSGTCFHHFFKRVLWPSPPNMLPQKNMDLQHPKTSTLFCFNVFFSPCHVPHICWYIFVKGARSSTQRKLHESGCGTFLCNKCIVLYRESPGKSRPKMAQKYHRVHRCFFMFFSKVHGLFVGERFFLFGESFPSLRSLILGKKGEGRHLSLNQFLLSHWPHSFQYWHTAHAAIHVQ